MDHFPELCFHFFGSLGINRLGQLVICRRALSTKGRGLCDREIPPHHFVVDVNSDITAVIFSTRFLTIDVGVNGASDATIDIFRKRRSWTKISVRS